MNARSSASLILVDWGTTNLRAWHIEDGVVVGEARAVKGVLSVAPGGFPAVLDEIIGAWRAAAPGAPVLMAGMVGSTKGWVDAGYVPCPADLTTIGGKLMPVPGERGTALVVPGVSCHSSVHGHDVMRGEECQVFGARALLHAAGKRDAALFCLPGTHTKWVGVRGDAIAEFATYMTGEVRQLLLTASILAPATIPASLDGAAFARGLAHGRKDEALTHLLFRARADTLFAALPSEGVAAYVSGLLIAHELRHALETTDTEEPIVLVGAPVLVEAYEAALAEFGRRATVIDGDAAMIAGLLEIAAAANVGVPR